MNKIFDIRIFSEEGFLERQKVNIQLPKKVRKCKNKIESLRSKKQKEMADKYKIHESKIFIYFDYNLQSKK